jgi:uncharacterized membrane protein YraQ (UPF0718 family)
MIHELSAIAEFVINNFIHIWPYLMVSIPLAVALQVSNVSKHIRKAFVSRPLVAILLATLVGAFSPFCSCSVVPIITSLLISGVPLGPVMAFWIASPAMDPEVFVLSIGVVGFDLAVARLVATLVLSLSGGFIAHGLEQRGFFADGILREQRRTLPWWASVRRVLQTPLTFAMSSFGTGSAAVAAPGCCGTAVPMAVSSTAGSCGCGSSIPLPLVERPSACGCGSSAPLSPSACGCGSEPLPLKTRIFRETINTTRMILKFMLIAFVLEALITFYIPQDAVVTVLGNKNPLAIVLAGLIGVPMYTSNLAALPLVEGLLGQGMLPGAALAFLIAGPTTTIPAMSAVYGITKPRVFLLYVSLALFGSIILGYGYQLLLAF